MPLIREQPRQQPNSPGVRVLLVLAGFSLLGLLGITRCLTPDPSGMGTHQQLGLPPCGLVQWFGIPCPSCGMTTSWAYLTRGQIPESLSANPAGTLMGLTALVFGLWLATCGMMGRWVLGLPGPPVLGAVAATIVLVTTVNWVIRILW